MVPLLEGTPPRAEGGRGLSDQNCSPKDNWALPRDVDAITNLKVGNVEWGRLLPLPPEGARLRGLGGEQGVSGVITVPG